ncbi:delta-12 fatty acid desaturase 2-like protein [Leptotrombidium deliense]|uniref:Delta-12 fatty acid desaturase 2-like protein n=1 Tax=Leptotrombidium deliense TaxID=299467 RepID=A0A443SPG3_9ACAR|nr:delta-12 fatty acid desaturase 2-like protein [Leptotrombidium deliense]
MDEISLKTLHDAIPKRLFERSALKSTLYLLYSIFLVVLTFGTTYHWVNNVLPEVFFWPAIVFYWLLQGTIATGIWVIAHECGHQAYSDSEKINDSVGLVLHSALLTPYHSWKYSHAMHHRATGHMKKDQVFVPPTRKQYYEERQSILAKMRYGMRIITGIGVTRPDTDDDNCKDNEYLSDVPMLSFFMNVPHLIGMLLFGWPMYLLMNASGQKYDRWASHFMPNSPIFNGKIKREVHISNIALVVMLSILSYVSYVTSFSAVAIYYIGPYLFVNAWLVLITYLHHTDPRLPHYRDGAWTYVKGALSTIDRNYGWFINHVHHHIGDTHVAHHLFSRIPHYNAVEVTKILKPLLGGHYNFDDTFFLKSLWFSFTRCHYVPDEGDVLFYKK